MLMLNVLFLLVLICGILIVLACLYSVEAISSPKFTKSSSTNGKERLTFSQERRVELGLPKDIVLKYRKSELDSTMEYPLVNIITNEYDYYESLTLPYSTVMFTEIDFTTNNVVYITCNIYNRTLEDEDVAEKGCSIEAYRLGLSELCMKIFKDLLIKYGDDVNKLHEKYSFVFETYGLDKYCNYVTTNKKEYIFNKEDLVKINWNNITEKALIGLAIVNEKA